MESKSVFVRARVARTYIAEGWEARELRALDPEALEYFGLRRGDIVTFETVEQELKTELVREYRYGYSGQMVERVKARELSVLNTERLKLWRTGARGWYWLEVRNE